jgi:hypothetical protein
MVNATDFSPSFSQSVAISISPVLGLASYHYVLILIPSSSPLVPSSSPINRRLMCTRLTQIKLFLGLPVRGVRGLVQAYHS